MSPINLLRYLVLHWIGKRASRSILRDCEPSQPVTPRQLRDIRTAKACARMMRKLRYPHLNQKHQTHRI